MTTNEERPAFYAEWRYVGLHLSLCRFACGLGKVQKTREWALTGVAAAKGRKAGILRSMLATYVWPFLVEDGELGEALNQAHEAYALMKVVVDAKAAGRGIESLMDADEATIQAGRKDNHEAERAAARIVIPPSLFKIGATLLESATEASRLAHQLADACDSISSASGIAEYWRTLSSFLRDFAAQPPDVEKARAMARAQQGDDDRALLAPCEHGPAIHYLV